MPISVIFLEYNIKGMCEIVRASLCIQCSFCRRQAAGRKIVVL